MGSNFNIGSFNAINTDEEKHPKKSGSGGVNDDLRKKLLYLGGIILGGVLILFLILFIVSSITGKNYSYDDMEEIMTNAAIAYFEDNPDKLPSENQKVEIDVATLAASGYMDELVEYTGEDSTCTGKVTVQVNGDDYLYIPNLQCGDDYATQALYDVVVDNIVTEGYGLYEIGDNYVYRGESVNNYLQLDNALWRIVKINEKGQFMLILDTEISTSYPWDNRYNSNVGYNSGINTYSASRIRDTLNEYYATNDEEIAILSNSDRSKLDTFDLCVGKRSEEDTTKDNSAECSETFDNQNIGLLTASDYMVASLDVNCNKVGDRSCQNYNYLVSGYRWWLVTASSTSTKDSYSVSDSGVASSSTTSSYMKIRPVVMLDASVLYAGGKGTVSKPYTLK